MVAAALDPTRSRLDRTELNKPQAAKPTDAAITPDAPAAAPEVPRDAFAVESTGEQRDLPISEGGTTGDKPDPKLMAQLDRSRQVSKLDPARNSRETATAANASDPTKGLPDPDPMDDHKDYKLTTTPGQLFVDGASPTDVVQGGLADCYFASSMASVAHANPDAVKDAVTDNGDGTYKVRFYNNRGKPEYVNVDADLYRYENGNPTYARGTDPKERWPSIVEKGYAQWKGGYEKIGNGGNSGDALHALTGNRATYHGRATSDDKMFAAIKAGEDGSHPMVAGTYGKEKEKKYNETGVSTWHAYSVLGTQQEGDDRFVTLRNPWGSVEFKSDEYTTDVDFDGDGSLDGDDGIFRMRLDDFRRLYKGVHIGR